MMHGLEVEEVIGGQMFEHVVVGNIIDIKPHPNAEKLRLATVVISPNGQPLEIVCGAPNIAVGQKVPVALIGAKLPNGLTIAKRAIRGIESNGMICAVDELGLGHDHSGVMVLQDTAKVGTPFAEVVEADEEVLDLAVPANRADLMAMRGLAWEIGAMLGQTAKLPTVKLKESKVLAKKSVTLKISDPKLCTLLTARLIRGVTMKPIPALIVNRLRAAGMRSVNIIADITNYVMLEYGQPLHAYDASLIKGGELVARSAKTAERLMTLDGKMRLLIDGMLVIADGQRIIGLAGVMGGAETAVSEKTTDILLEAGIFDPVSIRKTSRQFGLMSEASKRFEKGLWPSLPERASAAAAAMIVDLCGGTVEQGSVSVGSVKSTSRTLSIKPTYISERLGTKVPLTKSKTILTKLGFGVKGTATSWKVTVPEWRIDVTLPEDIVDEVGRMIGYEKLPKAMPSGAPDKKELPPLLRFKEEVKNILVDMGMTEVISHAFYGIREAVIDNNHFGVANSLDKTQYFLRKSLQPQIKDVLIREADAGHDAMIFEIGRIFDPEPKDAIEHQQPWKLALGITQKGDNTIKTMIKIVQKKLDTTILPMSLTVISELVRGRGIAFCEFDLKALMSDAKIKLGAWDPAKHIAQNVQYREQSKYPPVTRDIAFWWPKDEKTIGETIGSLDIDVLREFTIKDRFTKDGRTSFTLSFVYQSPDRTLTKAEVDKLEEKIKDVLVKLGAEIR